MVLIETEAYLSILLLLCTIRQSLGFLLICNVRAVMFNKPLVLFFLDVKINIKQRMQMSSFC